MGMTSPPPGYGGPGPGAPGDPDDPTRRISQPDGYPQQGPHGTQYAPQPGYGGYGQQGQYGPSGYGQSGQYGPGGWPPYPPPGGQPPPNRTGLIIGIAVVTIALIAGGGAVWYFVFGPGGAPDTDPPASNTPVASAPSSTPLVSEGSVSVDVEVGECIALGGAADAATADPVPCGSSDSNYRVVAKTPTSDDCFGDIDYTFFEKINDVEVGALCLDVDWVQGDCFDVSGDVAVRVDCATASGSVTLRVVETIRGVSDESNCPDAFGVPYDERNFVVCLESV